MRDRLGMWLVGGVLAVAPSVARAQTGGATAEALFQQGLQAMDAGQYDAACARFRESDRMDPAVGTKLNLARCEEKRGKLAAAWELCQSVSHEVPPSDPRWPLCKAVQDRLPKVVLKLAPGAPSGTTVRLGDVDLAGASFGVPIPVDAGPQTVSVRAPGRLPRSVAFSAAEGQVREVEIAPGDPLPAAPPPSEHGPERGGRTGIETLGWVLGGVGVVGLVGGSVTGAVVLAEKSTNSQHCSVQTHTCDQQGKDAASTGTALGVTTTVAWVVGAAALAGGITILVTRPKKAGETVGFRATPDGVRATWDKTW